jgi:hypothetical protein
MKQHDDDHARAPRQVGRRAVTRGAAWSVPVVTLAVAAPAAAHSGCHLVTGSLVWDTVANGPQLNKALATSGGTGVTVMVSVSGDTGHAGNGSVTGTTTGAQSKVMRFYDQNNVADTAQTITLTFSKAVQNVSFSLLDVDSETSGKILAFEDVVTILTPGWSGTTHSNVKGSGTVASPYRAVNTDSPVSGASSASNVDLAWAGPLTTIRFTYAQDGTVQGDPFMGISDIGFQCCD